VPLPWRRLRQDGVVDLGLRDRVYLVTGGSRGLGRATADALVGDGARVVIGARDPAAVAGAARELGMASAVGVAVDNADPAAPGRLVAAARESFGRLDGALISVGGPPGGTVAGTPDDAWRAAFESVFLGAVRLAVGVAAELADGGSIAFVLSTSVRSPIPDLAISNGLRPGLAGVAKTLADELGPRGIRVNGLLPGRVETGRTRELDALRGDPAQVRADLSARIPPRRYGTPEEFGRVAAFVLSPAASYLSGAMIPVDGGALRAL
jgi:3-oxoacyl-[acyl-carrier protein] reductase